MSDRMLSRACLLAAAFVLLDRLDRAAHERLPDGVVCVCVTCSVRGRWRSAAQHRRAARARSMRAGTPR